ncbi:unnamed protein product [Phytomonas sp. EM1]|nr:unnamed protein product [Phytomonas sp. EM1]|eukprot:CCW65762.1 unnamed protein product [Phytomonas sp. isolate EM1]
MVSHIPPVSRIYWQYTSSTRCRGNEEGELTSLTESAAHFGDFSRVFALYMAESTIEGLSTPLWGSSRRSFCIAGVAGLSAPSMVRTSPSY